MSKIWWVAPVALSICCVVAFCLGGIFAVLSYGGGKPEPVEEEVLEEVRPIEFVARQVLRTHNPRLSDDDLNALAWASVEASMRYKLDVSVVIGQIVVESHGDCRAVSSAGCLGPMQVSWFVWGEMLKTEGICRERRDLMDPVKGVFAGARILRQLVVRYGGDYDKALRHYSGGASRYAEKVYAVADCVRRSGFSLLLCPEGSA